MKAKRRALRAQLAGRVGKAVSIEAMDEAIAAEAALRHTRGKKR